MWVDPDHWAVMPKESGKAPVMRDGEKQVDGKPEKRQTASRVAAAPAEEGVFWAMGVRKLPINPPGIAGV